MDFFLRQLRPAFDAATESLARLIGADAGDLALIENATAAMNVVAGSITLSAGDEVLLTDHEYGAVRRIWQRACDRAGANLCEVALPFPPQSVDEVVDAVASAVTPQTRLVVISHITSHTALVLPAAEVCRRLRALGVAICIDGPHAVATLPLELRAIDCDYYTASCHKWLCAPFGSGFLYVHPRQQAGIQPIEWSWGRLEPESPDHWSDEFYWRGTRDPAALLSLPAAIEFMESAGLPAFRARAAYLARQGAALVERETGYPPVVDADLWHATMTLAELPPGETQPLRDALWRNHHIEIPIVEHQGRRFVRISCHLYNRPNELEKLATALRVELA
jgi:isopenicillin-N epimerase